MVILNDSDIIQKISPRKGERFMKTSLTFFTVVLVAVLMLAAAGYASGMHEHSEGEFTKHYAESLFKVTENGLYSVELVILGKELVAGTNTVDVIVHDKEDADVMGADIKVTPWMPEMGHGVREKPFVMERGGGLYSVENIDIIMTGHWELRIEVSKAGVTDTVVFDFPHVEMAEMGGMGHEHMIMEAPQDIDTSTTVTSENGLFKVSFESELDPIAINRFHYWRLTVQTPEGEPVTGAEIFIDGDMPEHGHGMPTQPFVTEELPGGVYVVEGMKFQMPGWWVVNFRIKEGDREDTVTFNLQLR